MKMAVKPIAEGNEGNLGVIKVPIGQFSRSMPAAATVNVKPGYLYKDNGSGALVLAAAGDGRGVVEGTPEFNLDNSLGAAPTDKQVTVVRKGPVRLVASGAITAKALIIADNNGKVQTIGKGTFDLVLGSAVTDAVNDGDAIDAYLE